MTNTKKISTSSENYLEVIYELSDEGKGVRSVDVAKQMQVSKASVNKAVGVLRDAGMADQQLYGTITLTEQGYQRAKEVARRHWTIKRFLMKVLEVDEETANNDACGMEHVISDVTMRRWTDYIERVLKDHSDDDDIKVITHK